MQNPRIMRLKVTGDIRRLLVERAPNTVTAEVPNDTQTALTCNTLDRMADPIEPRPRPHFVKRGIKRCERRRAHPLLQRNIRRHGETRTRVSKVTTDPRANINVDHVTGVHP